MSAARLSLQGLVVGRGTVAVAGPFDAGVAAGEALVVTGPNGAGKSTLLRTLAGLLPPLAGAIRLDGLVAADGEPAERLADAAHYVGHRHAMKGQISVGDNLGFWARYLGGGGGVDEPAGAAPESASASGPTHAVGPVTASGNAAASLPLSPAEALAAVGLAGLEAIPFAYLSAGQQRRASLARLLVADRPVWILDEPTSALDAASQGRFAEIVARHLATGGIAIAATHHPLGLEGAKTLHIDARDPRSSGPGTPDALLDEDDLASAEGWL
ncbi:heme ABC exporter ATP-binding protein CcmA [Aurantimonas sp. 22II-16-19i]|uniref:heme ABC exporter ATP-binding protein CcmA n=1 Tax=Aurantimonas sp. 22II-16-19i TaxID=1317114 RepID=UPI0009F7CBC4|nr:heme ABC exporter ATP-binding protein CcmA [Aurantimonas sp. 22II-16-19i]ORE93871.1 cytochrome c biogenesis protein CcmA [Aurantimonas sp. 22II-16-19i]